MKKQIELTVQQQNAIEMVKARKVSVLTGGPGTGKTTTILAIIDWAESEGLTVLQAAPTGKAAKKMIEATGRNATTIHALLGCSFDGGQFIFNHNQDNPIKADLLILDEISMITTDLMYSVLLAVSDRTRVLLVGDQNQLPSVGAGAILRDILSSNVVPHTELDMIHRNIGEIVQACHAIKNGALYTPNTKLDLEAENPINLVHIECFTPEDTLRAINVLASKTIPEKYGFDPIDHIQVISPVNTAGVLSCESINAVLRETLNPTEGDAGMFPEDDENGNPVSPSSKFRFGDKVINTKNDRATDTDGQETVIVNGDIGIIQNVTSKEITVLFADPPREVVIPKKTHNLKLAYCITCHKFQGSESPVIIIPVCNQFNRFLSNAWIYTAISRAKTICITVGTFGTIERAIRNRVPNFRLTRLREQLEKVESEIFTAEFEGI